MSTASENLAIAATNKAGRPTKYEPETVDRLLAALADGLTQKQACIASGICESTLAAWREKHPEFESRLGQGREMARQKALSCIKRAGEAGDWRASEAFLRLSFPADYRRDASINVNATAMAQAAAPALVCTEEQRHQLIAQLDRLKKRETSPASQGDHLQTGTEGSESRE